MTSRPDIAPAAAARPGRPAGQPYPRALAVITAAQLLLVVNVAMVYVAVPRMQAALGLSLSARALVTAGYAAAVGALLLAGGRVVDRIGARRALVTGLTVFGGAAVLGAAAHEPATLITARVLQGVAAALIAPAALAVIPAAFPDPGRRRHAAEVFGTVAALGITVGIGLGGLLTQYASWRWCLWIDVPAALLLAVLSARQLPAGRPVRRPLGIPGTVLLAGALGSLLLAAQVATGPGRRPLVAAIAVGAAVLLLVGFVAGQRRGRDPLVSAAVLAHRPRPALYLISLLVNAAQLAVLFFLTFYFQSVLHFGPGHTALLFLPFTLAILAGAAVCLASARRVRGGLQLAIGAGVAAAGLLWLTRLDGTPGYLVQLLPAEIAVGAGLAAVLVPLAAAVPAGDQGAEDNRSADALITATHETGGALGIGALNAVFVPLVAAAASPAGELRAYHVVFAGGAVLFGIAMAVALLRLRGGPADPTPSANERNSDA